MFIRELKDIENTDFFFYLGNATSHRLLTEKDGMGFTVCHTKVNKGSESVLEYKNHLEACYCIAGQGEIEDMKGNIHKITEGAIYVLDQHDKHFLRANQEEDLILVSIFNPPLTGTEKHSLSADGSSSY